MDIEIEVAVFAALQEFGTVILKHLKRCAWRVNAEHVISDRLPRHGDCKVNIQPAGKTEFARNLLKLVDILGSHPIRQHDFSNRHVVHDCTITRKDLKCRDPFIFLYRNLDQ